MKKSLLLLITISSLCFLSACTGSSRPTVIVTVQPAAATVPLGAGQTFMATVTGTTITAVTWTVKEGPAGGLVDNQGNYTAPQVAGTYHVIATSQADPSQSGSAAVKVPVAVSVSPNPATVFLGAMQPFMAMVAGTNNMAVTWSVQEGAAGGSVTSAGVYTAPQVVGTYHLIATSMADSTQTATAIINVPPVSVTVSPNQATVFLGAMQMFAANVTATNMAVTWSVKEGAAGGSVTSAGVYTAPQVVGTYHLIATSVADMTQTGTAIITVPPVAVTIAPTMDTLGPMALRSFGFSVTGSVNIAVTWSITEGAVGGTIDTNGDYVAPAGQGTFHVVVTSMADPSKSATATVTVVASGFLPTANMTNPRSFHTTTLLSTGEALVAGGVTHYRLVGVPPRSFCAAVATNAAELFDLATGSFAVTGPMMTPRSTHTATVLQDNTVLVAGGSPVNPPTAEIYNPVTAVFTLTGNMLSVRQNHTATLLLPGGKVLLAGGSGAGASAELFDPAMGTFAATGSMTDSRFFHTATLLLPSAKVLVAGGIGSIGTPLLTAELYEPVAGTFTATGSMGTPRIKHTATLLPNRTVLIAGGIDFTGVHLASAEIYNPMTGMFTPTGSMVTAHSGHTATLLPSGMVLIAGGGNFVAELYDPGTETFTQTGSMLVSRTSYAAALPFPSGQVLVTGSSTPVHFFRNTCSGGATASAELYK